MQDSSTSPLIPPAGLVVLQNQSNATQSISPRPAWISQMADFSRARRRQSRMRHATIWIVTSGFIDWLLIVATAVGGFFLGEITPNKRPFQLEDPDISFPYTLHETVSSRDLVIATVVVPVAVIIAISLVFTPGSSVPQGIPRSLVWRRKLWELYASLLSYGLGMASQWFIINGLKNICGKPRPDLLSRCQPDIQNVARYIVGGIANITSNGQLVSAAICTNTDTSILNDGFRSYPSGHSSSAAAGLGHLALFLAYKLRVVFPFARPPNSNDSAAYFTAAFPSRTPTLSAPRDPYELHDMPHPGLLQDGDLHSASSRTAQSISHESRVLPERAPLSARQAGAAPPLYLLVIVLVPLFGSVFIAASRWFNFRHHGFDILFGYSIGAVTTLIAFRLYQLPLTYGAGWAWGPRSPDKAFWAGVGSNSWAEPWEQGSLRTYENDGACETDAPHSSGIVNMPLSQRPVALRRPAARGERDNSLDTENQYRSS